MKTYIIRRPGAEVATHYQFGPSLLLVGDAPVQIKSDANAADVAAAKKDGLEVRVLEEFTLSIPAKAYGRPELHVTLPDGRAVKLTRGGEAVACALSGAQVRDFRGSGLTVEPMKPPTNDSRGSELTVEPMKPPTKKAKETE